MHQTMRGWKLHRKTDEELADIAKIVNPVIRGWVNYYGSFYKSAMHPILRKLNQYLIRWVAKKYKRVNGRQKQAQNWLAKIAQCEPRLFIHWQMGITPTIR
ncbi:hypothetical protein SPSIL_024400 [Sporomusa silvacetica DSM 10669]|uniref:Group II intron maturase-specific domain-containing protein n=1 Tax=Sporomusa silvacetica DSM 10669 TaxID=1123289 RepID=A0ABZ3IKU5_9FIRM|nr:group II intron maturase-specific domain-containing protein [Sporomusa silvacetica]OZC13399.1 group II intron, maturase-specific domain [Sporomusa silvacetica DSM 10669]